MVRAQKEDPKVGFVYFSREAREKGREVEVTEIVEVNGERYVKVKPMAKRRNGGRQLVSMVKMSRWHRTFSPVA